MSRKRYEDLLAEDGFLVYKGTGTSMLPAFRPDRDLMVVVPAAGRLRKYDVALYRRPDGRYVLHRALSVRPHDYAFRGDNCARMEYGVTDDDILGVMTAFVRDGQRVEVSNPWYRLYVRLWCALPLLRRVYRLCKKS